MGAVDVAPSNVPSLVHSSFGIFARPTGRLSAPLQALYYGDAAAHSEGEVGAFRGVHRDLAHRVLIRDSGRFGLYTGRVVGVFFGQSFRTFGYVRTARASFRANLEVRGLASKRREVASEGFHVVARKTSRGPRSMSAALRSFQGLR